MTSRSRLATKFALGAAVVVFVASIGLTTLRLAEQWRVETRIHRSDTWLANQAALELGRFRTALFRLQSGAPGLDLETVETRFEIFWSRMPILMHGEWRDGRALPELEVRIAAVQPLLPRIEREMVSLREGSPGAVERIDALLGEAEPDLIAINRDLHLARIADVEAARVGRLRLEWTLLLSLGGLLASTAVLSALFAAESRRARRAQRLAETAGERASEAQHTLRVLIDALPTLVLACDARGRILFANEVVCRFGGFTEAQAIGRRPGELGDFGHVEQDIMRVVAQRQALPFAERMVTDSLGRERILLNTTAPVLDSQGGLACVVRIAIDITDRKRVENRMRHMAEHDNLTDLPNRLLFAARLNAALRDLAPGRSVAVHCLDLDRFKEVNDSLGHPAGDRLLLAAAARMLGCLREGDMLARLGGDEFAVIQPSVPRREDAERMAARLVTVLAEPFQIEGYAIASGCSIGTVLAPEDGLTAEALLQRADIALYKAKSEGRGRACIFSPALEAGLAERRQIEAELGEAIAAEQLTLAYQPKFHVADGRLVGCEALVRWPHPQRGQVSPAIFVPIAEETGLVATLTRQVLERACRQARAWHAAGHGVPIAVNISATLFGMERAVEMVRRALDSTGCPPGLIEVEVTEGVFLRNADTASRAFAALREMGVRVALDDFGTGFSSLGYLQRLPVDVIKIDRAFIRDLDEGGRSQRIVDAVVRLAHGLGAEAVAEGVETQEQLAALRSLGCDQAQGFLLGRPMSAEALTGLLPAPAAPAKVPDLRLYGT